LNDEPGANHGVFGRSFSGLFACARTRWESQMRIVIVDNYYRRFLAKHYSDHPSLASASYEQQKNSLAEARFATSDFYSRHLKDLGCEAVDLIANCRPLQSAWSRENGAGFDPLTFAVPHRFYRVPLLGSILAALPGYLDVAMAQIRSIKPDVLYCHDLTFFPPAALREIKQHVRLIVGQIASPLPPVRFLRGFDLILTSFPHFVPRLKALGIPSEYLRLGFEPSVSDAFKGVARDIPVSFVGGMAPSHRQAIPLLEHLARHTPIRFFGYGVDQLPATSPIRERFEGEVWGLGMYGIMARSRITVNRHIAVAENYANNMRLYESTGMGALLLTEKKDNLEDLFEPGREVETYRDPDEAVEKINALLPDAGRLDSIAAAGTARTLRDHTFRLRMREVLDILNGHLRT
jgi:spore maturation protein CgeB